VLHGIVRVVNDERTAEAIAVLDTIVRVIPEGTGLTARVEGVGELVAWGDRALADEGGPVGEGGVLLEETVPVLDAYQKERSSEGQ
jgi:hypothetical protein